MLKSLFAKPSKPRPASSMPAGKVVYAIGDVHGRADLLRVLLNAIVADARTTESEPLVIGLGDYIDRGQSSKEVIGLLLQFQDLPGIAASWLRGNHDQSLLDFLADPEFGPTWGDYGGRETLKSYGVEPPVGRDIELWAQTRDAFEAALPPEHLAFFQGLKLSLQLGDYFFAHAGARPGVPLDQQEDRDLYWIREPFLSDRRPFDKIIVHGHSISMGIHVDDRRIGVDTGAYATGRLTAVRLEGDERSFLYTDRGPKGLAAYRQRQSAPQP
jgi:serine/threonine protein phosphatase 1